MCFNSRNFVFGLGIIISFALAIYTQCSHLTAVPGLHFDEAWQGVFSYRILTEPGFFPVQAMNSYTTPFLHYLLAGVFKISSPSLLAMRTTFVTLNLATLILLCALLIKLRLKQAVCWFIFFWALIPVAVHNHRFYVELTAFHSFCFAIFCWGLVLWKQKPYLSLALLSLSLIIATYSHVLFIVVYFSSLLIFSVKFPQEFSTKKARFLIALMALSLAPLGVRMYFELNKLAPLFLSLALICLALTAILSEHVLMVRGIWLSLPQVALKIFPLLLLICFPFLLIFLFLFWNGFWPYAQATGALELWWLPINVITFLILVFKRKTHPIGIENIIWGSFIVSLLLTHAFAFKPNTRYYTVPLLLFLLWCSIRFSDLKPKWLKIGLAVCLLAWNFWAFEKKYIYAFESAGPINSEFKFFIFHDSGRDFRPFQKAYQWALQQNCQKTLGWIEDDRFLFPLRFLQLTAPDEKQKCAWEKTNLYFSHIPNYPQNYNNQEHIIPPVENVKFLAHFKNWGDLAFWVRK